jgi:hypothetical protein
MYGVRLNGFETAFKKRFSFRYRYLAGLIGDGQHIAKALAFANCECSVFVLLFALLDHFHRLPNCQVPTDEQTQLRSLALPIPCRMRQEAK